MRYVKFTIHKYKAIHGVEIGLSRNLMIPIIGVNESGKTSILQAIFAFSQNNDNFGGGNHLSAKNRYEPSSTGYEVSADLLFNNKDEIDSIVETLSENYGLEEESDDEDSTEITADQLKEQFYSLYDKTDPLRITRNLEDYSYHI